MEKFENEELALYNKIITTSIFILLQDDFDVPRLSVCSEQQNVGEDEVGPQDIRQVIADYLF